jgi:hypothetical protein
VKIAKKTKSTVGQLAVLNEIQNPDRIFPGQSLLYVSKRDLENARLWAEKRRQELPPENQDHRRFILVLEDLQSKNIAYWPTDFRGGTHALIVICFSQAWEEYQKKIP